MSIDRYSEYDQATGLFSGRVLIGLAAEDMGASLAPGCAALVGDYDRLSQQVELRPDDFGNAVVPVVVDYQPPQPPDDEWKTWAWNAEAKRWVSAPTMAALAMSVRAERDRRMAAFDWVTLRAVRAGRPVPPAWAAFLQALADVPEQQGFPYQVQWPLPPGDESGSSMKGA